MSRDLAKRNSIKEEKNYSIILVRIALFIFKQRELNVNLYDAIN